MRKEAPRGIAEGDPRLEWVTLVKTLVAQLGIFVARDEDGKEYLPHLWLCDRSSFLKSNRPDSCRTSDRFSRRFPARHPVRYRAKPPVGEYANIRFPDISPSASEIRSIDLP